MMLTALFRFHRGSRLAVLSLFALASAAACSGGHDDPSAAPVVGTENVSITGAGDENARSQENTDYDVKRYDVKGELDWDRSRLVATAGITLERVDPSLRTIALDSAVAEVKAVRLANGEPLHFEVDAEHHKLRVDLPHHSQKRRLFRLEVDYEAEGVPTSEPDQEARLFMLPALKGDPHPSRVAYTFNEPFGARVWMPCHDTPSDRAVYSVDMRMPAHEKLLANGDLIFDEPDARTGTHRMKYDSGFTLPTYIMALSIGDFEVETTHAASGRANQTRDVPVSLWHRRGLPNDYGTALTETVRALETYEKLAGPYPFKTYSAVFTPGEWFEENATVSLLGESGLDFSQYFYVNVAGHELAHQWFGDLVTTATFYDLWFKEGMATLLEMENMRPYLDEEKVGTLGSERRPPSEGQPIVRDRSVPILPYGSGPYGRAAWLLTQVRSLIGDDAFWSTLRKVLRDNRYGVVGTDDVVEAFATRLGADATARVRRALVAKSIPRLQVLPLASGAAGALVTLRDPDGALVTPMIVQWIAPDGASREQTLTVDAPIELSPRVAGEFLVIDPLDVHPDAKVFAAQDSPASGKNYESSVVPLLVPEGAQAIARWLHVGGVHQLALLSRTLPVIAPNDFEPFVRGLDAEGAKMLAIQRACDVAVDPKHDPETRTAWSRVIARALAKPPLAVGLRDVRKNRLAACGKVVDIEHAFAGEWDDLETGLPSGGMSTGRVAFLSAFDLPPAREFSVWSSVAKRSTSLNQREQAMDNLAQYAVRALIPSPDIPAWRAFFVEMLSQSETWTVLDHALAGVHATKGETAADNAAALAGLSTVLHDPLDYWYGEVHKIAVCTAYALIPGAPAAPEWHDFVRGLSDANLKADVRAYVDSPSASCN